MNSFHEREYQNPDEYRDLEVFYERARLLQQELDQLTTDEAVLALKYREIDALHQAYPYLGQPVITRGKGIFPVADEGGVISGVEGGVIDQSGGKHDGFYIVQIEDEDDNISYRLMHKILVGTIEADPLPVLHTTTEIYHFFNLDAMILPLIELEQPFSPCFDADVIAQEKLDHILERSAGLVTMFRSKSFRSLSREIQFKTVDNYLIEADKDIKVRDLIVMAEPQYAYAPLLEKNSRAFVPLDVGKVVLIGTCLGLDSIESANLRGRAVRSDSDLGDIDAGICIVIDPNEDTKQGLNLNSNQVLYIPTANQSFDITLFQEY